MSPPKRRSNTGRAVQGHAELVLARDDPGLRLLSEESSRNDASRCWSDLQAQVAARARVLDAVVLQYTHLLGDDVHLLADLGADLHQRVAIVRADALGLWQLVTHDVARQCRIQRLAAALLTLVASDPRRVLIIDFGRQCLRGRRERLRLVEE